ncbi:MAG TPA: MDR family oxidoreductase [Candidatus Competibacteraceae bacterium]|nr:MDR family oxidoreductase [Candidatus Competibacteraceae bacterium]HQA24866.1 MDR family oxidoreductase [Candidatus Competibacteraceae bacterium]HQD55724.1 MDR family oxidoreductase [Candidatus Competibacteraceae bacterium]
MSDSTTTFQALVLNQRDGRTVAEMQTLTEADLPAGEVLVAVEYSSLNYKDGLAVTGKGKIVRQFPMVPGIDLAGTVLESAAPAYRPGDRVVLTGWGVGERYWGGYTQRARVKAGWLTPLPDTLDSRRAMAIGTAGFTAMLCVLALEQAAVTPNADKPVLVTGASGGVGSVAVALLAHLGYQVTAVTGRPENEAYLRELGATAFIAREVMNQPCRPLETQLWSGVVDTVGGRVLARALAETDYSGAVAACGLAGGVDLPTTVMPFILRGVKLLGVDSVACPLEQRRIAWSRLAQDLPAAQLERMTQVVPLAETPRLAEAILAGQVRGRVVIDPNAGRAGH